MVQTFLTQFRKNVRGKSPSQKVFQSYFTQGYDYLSTVQFPFEHILNVEGEHNFQVRGVPFVGFIDVEAEQEGIVIVDHKSRALKQRSTRRKPTKTDLELDSYLRQLYLYSAAIQQQYGEYPTQLCFNCFRENTFIREEFRPEVLHETEEWALRTIDAIVNTEDWRPRLNWFKCNYICDVCESCEFYHLL